MLTKLIYDIDILLSYRLFMRFSTLSYLTVQVNVYVYIVFACL